VPQKAFLLQVSHIECCLGYNLVWPCRSSRFYCYTKWQVNLRTTFDVNNKKLSIFILLWWLCTSI